jgi:transcriptional regulator with XRE-family HTH domain
MTFKDLRETLHWDEKQMASMLNLNVHSYMDLEEGRDKAADTLELRAFRRLAEVAETSPRLLIDEVTLTSGKQKIRSFGELQEIVKRAVATHARTLDEVENSVGWRLTDFLGDVNAAWRWNLIALNDICSYFGVDASELFAHQIGLGGRKRLP